MIRFSIDSFISIEIVTVGFTFIIGVFWEFKSVNLLKLAKSMFKEIGLIVSFQVAIFIGFKFS